MGGHRRPRRAALLHAAALISVLAFPAGPHASHVGNAFLADDLSARPSESLDRSPEASLDALVAQDRRVAAIAFRLVVANRDLCTHQAPLFGLTLHAASVYGPRLRGAARTRFRLGEAVVVSGVVPGGAAEAAGLRAGDELLSIGGAPFPIAARGRDSAPATYSQIQRTWELLARVEGATSIQIRRGGEVLTTPITPVVGCAYDVQVTPSTEINASADGRHVFITSAFVDYLSDDNDLALVLGHELAHDVLQHRATLDRRGFARGLLGNYGSSPADLNRVEREADYVGLYLTARAGYPVDGAEAFWRRSIRDMGDPWYRRWSHPGSHERAESARATVEEITAAIRAGRPLEPDPARLLVRRPAPR